MKCITDKDEGTYRVANGNEVCGSELNIYALLTKTITT